jgi:hypothetical protein
MDEWRKILSDVMEGRQQNSRSAGAQPKVVAAIEEFAGELKKAGRLVVANFRPQEISLMVTSASTVEMELVIRGETSFTISLFSPGTVVTNLNIGSLGGLEKEQMLRALALLYGASIRSQKTAGASLT